MRRFLGGICGAAVLLMMSATPALAWHSIGWVYCDTNQNGVVDPADTPFAGVKITVRSLDGAWTFSAVTDTDGYYRVDLQDFAAEYTLTVDPGSLPAGASVVLPSGGTRRFFDTEYRLNDILIASPTCVTAKCWMTGGGAKFSPITNGYVAEHGPKHSFGGNVNPGCNAESGEGGQWNHVAHALKLHFQGFAIRVVRCGNSSDHPPGSESPVTPYNFIEFEGTGRLMGIRGDSTNLPNVHFWARVEDRNEPGSNGAKDGALVDRYFLKVFGNPADPNGSTLLLIDVDGAPATVDPVTITDGNLQLHISSCELPPQ